MRPLDIATAMLDQIQHDPEDRLERTRLANSLGITSEHTKAISSNHAVITPKNGK